MKQIGKTTDQSSYMIGRTNGNEESEIAAQLFGQEILSMRTREASERKRHANNRRYVTLIISIC